MVDRVGERNAKKRTFLSEGRGPADKKTPLEAFQGSPGDQAWQGVLGTESPTKAAHQPLADPHRGGGSGLDRPGWPREGRRPQAAPLEVRERGMPHQRPAWLRGRSEAKGR